MFSSEISTFLYLFHHISTLETLNILALVTFALNDNLTQFILQMDWEKCRKSNDTVKLWDMMLFVEMLSGVLKIEQLIRLVLFQIKMAVLLTLDLSIMIGIISLQIGQVKYGYARYIVMSLCSQGRHSYVVQHPKYSRFFSPFMMISTAKRLRC